jgi:hypothetical protein
MRFAAFALVVALAGCGSDAEDGGVTWPDDVEQNWDVVEHSCESAAAPLAPTED